MIGILFHIKGSKVVGCSIHFGMSLLLYGGKNDIVLSCEIKVIQFPKVSCLHRDVLILQQRTKCHMLS